VVGASNAAVLFATRCQLAAGLLEAWSLLQITDAMAGFLPGPLERRLRRLLPACAALALIPGVAYAPPFSLHAFEPWGAIYVDPSPTWFAGALYVIGPGLGPVMAIRLWRAWRRGVRYAGVYGLSILGLTALAINDALSQCRVVAAPYLLDVGALLPVGALAWSHLRRFLEESASLAALRGRLETLVEERTMALSQTQAALLSTEKLAAFGRFAGGLAHQVNNPASVVQSGIGYLHGELAEGRVPPDAGQVLEEAVQAMRRITSLVRRLVDAGRIADRPARAVCLVGPIVERALAGLRATARAVQFTSRVGPGLAVAMAAEDLKAVLEAILSNAGAAFPPGRRGRISVAVTGLADQVRIEVVDDGIGMSAEVLRQAFDPFFSTRGDGHGAAGLGLPIARSLVEAAGGTLTLQSEQGRGTRVTVGLPEAQSVEEPARPLHLAPAPMDTARPVP
jgi:signal transduction histidine kinase